MRKKIEYHTPYDSMRRVCGYVLADVRGDGYHINMRQYNNACAHLLIGEAGRFCPVFHTDRTVYVDIDDRKMEVG